MGLTDIIRASTPTIRRSSWLRRRFAVWLANKFMVCYGPAMYRVRNEYHYVDDWGAVWRLVPTHDPSIPFSIQRVSA
jgi:hypothetical protein